MRKSKTNVRRTVLVVDDERFVRLMVVDGLQEAGHFAVEASDAEEALSHLQTRADIDVVFSDIRMPGPMNGIGLAHAIRQRWPKMPVILTSGHVSVPDPTVEASFVRKPYLIPEIVAHIEGC